MTGRELGEAFLSWTVLMLGVAGVTAVVVFALPRLRPRLAGIVCVTIGSFGIALGWLNLMEESLPALLSMACGGVDSRGDVLTLVVRMAGACLAGTVAAWAAFHLEKLLLGIRFRESRSDEPVSGIPQRAESMEGVARVVAHPWAFIGLSFYSALGEELLFRASMLSPLWFGPDALGERLRIGWWLLLVQGVLFGLVHLTFGWRTVLAKSVLGVLLGCSGLFGGVVAGALVPHLVHQVLVLRQFTSQPWWGNAKARRRLPEQDPLMGIPVPSRVAGLGRETEARTEES
ncbi:MAG: CPBP family intramembrane metalloprotease [Propionibacteriaceae bacterium]|nr:CPBP family intramembrane metalloprotease [Propionibacteriaceae bacterium]